MTLTYKDRKTKEEKKLFFTNGVWSGEDAELVTLLNADPCALLDHYEYFPTTWHQAKATADALKGTLDEPEPEFETGDQEGVAQ